jgi:hypothetical protein
VYNRDNRLKVSQDEAKAAAEEAAERQRAEQAEREFRHSLLLKRAAGEDGSTDTPALPAPSPAARAALPAPPQHINFWSEEEAHAKAQHPEVEVRGGPTH